MGPKGGLLKLFLLRSYKVKPSVSKRLPLLQIEGGSDALERQRAKNSSQFRSKNKVKIPESPMIDCSWGWVQGYF